MLLAPEATSPAGKRELWLKLYEGGMNEVPTFPPYSRLEDFGVEMSQAHFEEVADRVSSAVPLECLVTVYECYGCLCCPLNLIPFLGCCIFDIMQDRVQQVILERSKASLLAAAATGSKSLGTAVRVVDCLRPTEPEEGWADALRGVFLVFTLENTGAEFCSSFKDPLVQLQETLSLNSAQSATMAASLKIGNGMDSSTLKHGSLPRGDVMTAEPKRPPAQVRMAGSLEDMELRL